MKQAANNTHLGSQQDNMTREMEKCETFLCFISSHTVNMPFIKAKGFDWGTVITC